MVLTDNGTTWLVLEWPGGALDNGRRRELRAKWHQWRSSGCRGPLTMAVRSDGAFAPGMVALMSRGLYIAHAQQIKNHYE